MADIFLSYAREDIASARRIAEMLESSGWSVWWDRRIPPGQDFTAYIQRQLDEARCIVVLWSKASVASHFVRDEATEGLKGGRLVPTLLETVTQPLGFRQIQAADLANWTGDASHEEFSQLVESISVIAPRKSRVAAIGPGRASLSHSSISSSELPEGLSFDAYVSYSYLDNLEIAEGRPGWVTNLQRALQARLAQVLGRDALVAMSPMRATGDMVDAAMNVLQQSAALIVVVSPRYVASDWGLSELRRFPERFAEQSALRLRERARVFKVVKTPVPNDMLPMPLQPLLGYEFFKVDPETGKTREFSEGFGEEAEREFWLRLDDLTYDLAAFLQELSAKR